MRILCFRVSNESWLGSRWHDKDVDLKKTIRFSGIFTIIIGILQFSLTVATYVWVASPKNGAFWSSFFVIFTGLFGLLAINKFLVNMTTVISFVSVVVALAGAIQDGTAGDIVGTLEACIYTTDLYDVEAYKYDGHSKYNINAEYCVTKYYETAYTCYCVNKENACYFYSGAPGGDCSSILNGYFERIAASAAFDTVGMLCCLAIFMITTVSSCIKPAKKALTSKEAAAALQKEMLESGGEGTESVTDEETVYNTSGVVEVGINPLVFGKH